ncbi:MULTISPECIES: helix-turn-helix domain-containing protein [Mameliella]|uniref:Helix-turn-helix domain protein n=1 Tax=Mameliella alba TaxID=561184 RepID=A0A0B3S5S5_9RHOB|nr:MULTISPECIES: helix-turn-helix transcriptional regulator [Mameliella]KHQ52021.1 Helix-turn-helix domain protein [Mameliella alba]MDD9731170.1 helix-turn-helix transcriptional regulator [Mameliella sp. AT18]ODM46052.1 transcriptional regulator [Ruegeria sp. PBVC088]
MSTHRNPHADSRLAHFVERRILELSGVKTQKEIAREAGFTNANMLSMIKSGDTKLALDRVPDLAKALDCDPKALFMMALEQAGLETTKKAVEDIFGTLVSANEVAWLEEIRAASGGGDPRLTARARAAIRSIF